MTILSLEEIVQSARTHPDYGYGGRIEEIRKTEYSHIGGRIFGMSGFVNLDAIYLDHAGATPYPVSTIAEHSKELITTLLSNPHSRSASSIATTKRIATIRLRLLEFFNASPQFFDVVFVANATAGIKLVAEGFSGHKEAFQYVY